jgi:hypothetical protein
VQAPEHPVRERRLAALVDVHGEPITVDGRDAAGLARVWTIQHGHGVSDPRRAIEQGP